jgi:hypothetical protein
VVSWARRVRLCAPARRQRFVCPRLRSSSLVLERLEQKMATVQREHDARVKAAEELARERDRVIEALKTEVHRRGRLS